jgi:oligogalacturonide lyase
LPHPSRRALLFSGAALWQSPGDNALRAADWGRYADPATEFEVLRLTSPSYTSRLPQGAALRRDNALCFASDREGAMQVWRLELANGKSRPLTSAAALDPATLALAADGRGLAYFDGPRLRQHLFSRSRTSEWTDLEPGEQPLALAGTSAGGWVFAAGAARGCRLALQRGQRTRPETLATRGSAIVRLEANPRQSLAAWLDAGGRLGWDGWDGRRGGTLAPPDGRILDAHWSPGGRSLIYLFAPERPGAQHELYEYDLDAGASRQLARTTQFVCFGSNSAATVFAGASGSLASPYVMLLLRQTQRELTLCEHRSSTPARAAVQFSPDSQRVFFESDRHGKPAIYSIAVDRLVERTP